MSVKVTLILLPIIQNYIYQTWCNSERNKWLGFDASLFQEINNNESIN